MEELWNKLGAWGYAVPILMLLCLNILLFTDTPMVLGKLGLLKGKKATCYPSFEQYLEGAECIDAPVVRDGNIITGMGPGAAMEFALTIVDLLVGKEKVDELVEAMCVKR